MLVFRQAVDDCDLIDLSCYGPTFTRNNKRDGMNNVQERLDWILADHQWADKFPHARLDHMGFYSSDHRPLLLTFSFIHITQKGRNRARLSGWSKERFGSLRKLINDNQHVIDSLYQRSGEASIMPLFKNLERNMEGLVAREEVYWKLRSRADWLVAGDRNSKFFHARASARKKKNFISKIIDDDAGIARVGVVGGEFSRVCLQVLKGEASISEFNYTNVVLIPKVKNPMSLKDFRPIFLYRVVYKTVTKVMANRLKSLLPAIISPCQSAFFPRRMIFDNVIASFEILQSIAHKNSGNKGLMALKLDMSKAYDMAEWAFLRVVMETMGFPLAWIALVMDCISTSTLFVIINGDKICTVVPL
ncbi:hypothetical protein Dsin_001917 [Dipteronia sinensis]|uniref:Reverse transcriptase domain-containing protein n=1 Tax=Dipteronia sinensis TaxID=43782 RepID=A0AAE0B4T1_9ROSI|nr:hypothetical protein Dsin_001917 [Dipteronia sinensis]